LNTEHRGCSARPGLPVSSILGARRQALQDRASGARQLTEIAVHNREKEKLLLESLVLSQSGPFSRRRSQKDAHQSPFKIEE
jgi:hypothetical protein